MDTKDLLNLELIKEIEHKALEKVLYEKRISKRAHWINKISRRNPIFKRAYKNRCPQRYEVYIKSKWWEERKNHYYQAHGYTCEVCGSHQHIQLHHIWYSSYGSEPDDQLIALCRKHHAAFHVRYGHGTNDYRRQTEAFLLEEGNLNGRTIRFDLKISRKRKNKNGDKNLHI